MAVYINFNPDMFKDRSANQERLKIRGFGDRDSREMNCNMNGQEEESINGGEMIQMIAAEVPVIFKWTIL